MSDHDVQDDLEGSYKERYIQLLRQNDKLTKFRNKHMYDLFHSFAAGKDPNEHLGLFCRYDIREKFKSINTALCSFRKQTRGARKLDSQTRIRHLEKRKLEKRCEMLQASNAKLQADSKAKLQSLVRKVRCLRKRAATF